MKYNKSILLGNAPSSGSSLLVSLIGAHRDIFQTRELNLFSQPDWCADRIPDLRCKWARHQKKAYDAHFPCEFTSVYIDETNFNGFSSSKGSYFKCAKGIMKNLAAENDCSSFVEKTPNNIFSLPHIHDLEDDTLFIMIVRNPTSVLESLKKRGLSPFKAVSRWYFSNLVVDEMRRRKRCLVVNYEKLTADPEKEVVRIFDFLGMQAPSSSDLEKRRGAQTFNLPSWSNDAAGAVVNRAPPDAFPVKMGPIFERLRANRYFFDYCGIDYRDTSPLELAKRLGYQLDAASLAQKHPPFLFPWPEYFRYVAGCVRHRRKVRKTWHRWERM